MRGSQTAPKNHGDVPQGNPSCSSSLAKELAKESWSSWPQKIAVYRELQTLSARLISEPALQLHCNLFCSRGFGILHGPVQAQELGDLVAGTCTLVSQPCFSQPCFSQPCEQSPYRGKAVGGTGMFAGLNGGNPAERVIALAARALDSPAGVSCSREGHTKTGF